MFFSSIHADYTKMGYPAAIIRALDFIKNTDLHIPFDGITWWSSCHRRGYDVRQCG